MKISFYQGEQENYRKHNLEESALEDCASAETGKIVSACIEEGELQLYTEDTDRWMIYMPVAEARAILWIIIRDYIRDTLRGIRYTLFAE